ncbi:MAG: hypothetical protein VX986_04060, partial [Pseudomonadota bacterium]|nr:hypothetical protein [Pseudomonadota bacterium]
VGDGKNKKSLAFVENLAQFFLFCIKDLTQSGTYNYCDKPDFSMKEIERFARKEMGLSTNANLRVPAFAARFGALIVQIAARALGLNTPITPERVEKFLTNTTYETSRLIDTGFKPQWDIRSALAKTIESEFR